MSSPSADTGAPYPEPLQVNPKTGEIYIRLPEPHANIIITPPRATDADAIVAYMNDPRVAMSLSGPPFPYLHEHAVSWLKIGVPKGEEIRKEIEDTPLERRGGPFSGCPVRSIREVKEDGEEVFIGDVFFTRSSFFHIVDEEEAKRLIKENSERPVGDPEIEWAFSDYLAPSHHGRGIMSAAVKFIMNEWAIPRMNARHIVVNTHKDNIASGRVFEKNGFKLVGHVEDCKRRPESKGGQLYSLSVFEWRMPVPK